MADELSVTVHHEDGSAVVTVSGEVDLSSVSQLRDRLYELVDSGEPVIVDLEQVTFIDSTGLGALVGAYRRAAAHGGSLHAVCVHPQARRLLWLTGVDRRVPLSATLDEALASVAAARDAAG
jgi:anti-sigma B factor antagonist